MRKIHLNNTASLATTSVVNWAEANTTWHTAAPIITSTQQVAIAQNPWIMVIDDSATIRKILETCLGREGYEVKSFPDGVAAMRWLAESDTCIPNLIILDIELPQMDGYEVARRLKNKPQMGQAVIIMLTRRDGVADRLKGRLAGAKDYLVKPFRTQTLLSIVETHLGKPTH
ncbi:response regulator [Dictyobacter kobayashii]|uniref:Response regulatory domain-containing protein n=1 Tax=Dictyobacter kobayashii TaxID=2014872 RepID=A0A402AT23_9CHLR|nr:response regulator [Dictyobacter kobayashii]GCE22247.1 hypothetical protein KDK_60470 [Dictyobacter kobayashii]